MVSIAVYLVNNEIHIHSVLVIWLGIHPFGIFPTYLPTYLTHPHHIFRHQDPFIFPELSAGNGNTDGG